jgi:hypothetical protein
MLKLRRCVHAASLALAATLAVAPASLGEEMTVESNKVYTPGTCNGVAGYWVEYVRTTYVHNAFHIDRPVGRYDATIQEAIAGPLGLDRALTHEELERIYSKYGIPHASSKNYDRAAYHDFNWDQTLAHIKQDVAAGSFNDLSQPDPKDVRLLGTLLTGGDSTQLVDSLGASAVDAAIRQAFQESADHYKGLSAPWYDDEDARARKRAIKGADGGLYVFTGSDGKHTVSYSHGENYVNASQTDANTVAAYAAQSVESVLLNDPDGFKKLKGMGNVDSVVQAGRLTLLAGLVDKGLNPLGLKIDTWVNTANGPVHLVESQPTAERLRDLSRFLIASTWTTHSPIVLDLNHDGQIGVTGPSTAERRMAYNAFQPNGAVWFDLMANGTRQHIEWVTGEGDGFLVDDSRGQVSRAAAGDGVIDGRSLFGDAVGYRNGYHKLATMIGGVRLAAQVTPTAWSTLYARKAPLKGAALAHLKVWIDRNHDARVQPDELYSLASLGISEIGTVPVVRKNQHGEYVIQSYFVQHGHRYMTEDVWFAEDPDPASRR